MENKFKIQDCYNAISNVIIPERIFNRLCDFLSSHRFIFAFNNKAKGAPKVCCRCKGAYCKYLRGKKLIIAV